MSRHYEVDSVPEEAAAGVQAELDVRTQHNKSDGACGDCWAQEWLTADCVVPFSAELHRFGRQYAVYKDSRKPQDLT